jgi:dTDP-4-amino-4,6-dideoxygalactose transaminase
MKIEVYSPTIRRKEMDAVLTAMVEEKIGPGERNRLLIQTAKEQIHFDYALALRSPAVALHLALKALNIGKGQSVIISALSPRYYFQVIDDLQLSPLICDVTSDFPCMGREIIENTTVKTNNGAVGAIVLHHTLGFVPDTASVAELGIPVIEDISQSYGSWIKSFEKNETQAAHGAFYILGLEERDMLTSGGGALVFAMNKKDSALLRNFTGIADEYCLPDINAALAAVQFRELQRNMEKRDEISKIYVQASLRTRHKRFITRSEDENNSFSFSLVLETGLKDVIAYAKKKEILLENAFEKTIAGSSTLEGCPVSNSLALRTVLFPMYPRLRSSEVERVSRLIMTLP